MRKRLRQLWSYASILSLLLLASSAVNAPVAAADSCDGGDWCIFGNINYSGGLAAWVYDDEDYTNNYNDWNINTNDTASSAWNNGQCGSFDTVYVYVDILYDGRYDYFFCGEYNPNLNSIGSNDVWSSHLWVNT